MRPKWGIRGLVLYCSVLYCTIGLTLLTQPFQDRSDWLWSSSIVPTGPYTKVCTCSSRTLTLFYWDGRDGKGRWKSVREMEEMGKMDGMGGRVYLSYSVLFYAQVSTSPPLSPTHRSDSQASLDSIPGPSLQVLFHSHPTTHPPTDPLPSSGETPNTTIPSRTPPELGRVYAAREGPGGMERLLATAQWMLVSTVSRSLWDVLFGIEGP